MADESEVLARHVEEVCGSHLQSTGRRKILAILILNGRTASIFDIIEAGMLDIDLPLSGSYDKTRKSVELKRSRDPSPRRWWEGEPGQQNMQDPALLRTEPRCRFRGWSHTHLDLFRTYQSRMLAPFIRRSSCKVLFYKIPDEAVLPFLEWTMKKEGGYGNVYRVRIHQDHHELEPPPVSSADFRYCGRHEATQPLFIKSIGITAANTSAETFRRRGSLLRCQEAQVRR